jgi:hypothetical protein
VAELQQQHEMVLVSTQPSGADEWHCPTCGRRLVMRPAPDHQKIVITPGDERVIHIGAKSTRTTPLDTPTWPDDDPAWRDWLHSIGIDWDGSAA